MEYQSDEVCRKFKGNTIALNKAIHKLIMNPPVPGCELKHSKQLKSHLLFDWEIFQLPMTWRTLGGVDEQNTEGVHPQFNQLKRRFGNSGGAFQQNKVYAEFLFSHSTWMVETIDIMAKETKKEKGNSTC